MDCVKKQADFAAFPSVFTKMLIFPKMKKNMIKMEKYRPHCEVKRKTPGSNAPRSSICQISPPGRNVLV